MKALVIGATGATGKELVVQLLEDEAFTEVHIFVRRAYNCQNPKLYTLLLILKNHKHGRLCFMAMWLSLVLGLLLHKQEANRRSGG